MNELWNPDIIRIQSALQGKIRLVGGCVRDFILGVPPHDLDIATPWPPEQVRQLLKEAGIKSVPTSLFHGVITATIGSRSYEITTLRQDTCQVDKTTFNWIDDYATDALRRDFTINALSMDADGTIYDYTDGQADLANHIVRFIGDPVQRIPEDPIRICRYIRFWSLYGGESLDPTVLTIAAQNAYGLHYMSHERRRKELLKTLMSPRVIPALTALKEIDALPHLMPNADIAGLTILLQHRPQATVWERLFILARGSVNSRGDTTLKSRMERLARPVVYRDTRALRLILGDEGRYIFDFLLLRGLIFGDITSEEYQTLSQLQAPPLPLREPDLTGLPGMKKAAAREEAMKIIRRLWVDLDFPGDKMFLTQAFKNYMISIGRKI